MRKNRVKNSVGIWAFGPTATRFMPGGYHPEAHKESMEKRTERAVKGLGALVDGYEFHYPSEVNEKNVVRIQKILGDKDIYCLALGTFSDPRHALGSFTNPSKKIREETKAITRAGIDLAAEIGAKFIIWPGGEGYNYPFQVIYGEVWDFFIDGIACAAERAYEKNVTLLLEHKCSEPAMKIHMSNIGMALFVIHSIEKRGIDVSNVKINMDWMHLIMNGEHLAEYAALLLKEGLMGHHHGNSGWGDFDDDNMVGATRFMETLELALELRRGNYGTDGERIGFDLFPYTENQVEAVRRSVYHWEFINEIASRIDDKQLREAQKNKDAVEAYRIVYEALGLNKKFEAKFRQAFKKKD